MDEEKKLFKDIKLTEQENKMIEMMEEIYKMVDTQRNKKIDVEAYHIPTAYEDEDGRTDKNKKFKVLHDRYEEVKVELNEHELWEKGQIDRAKGDIIFSLLFFF